MFTFNLPRAVEPCLNLLLVITVDECIHVCNHEGSVRCTGIQTTNTYRSALAWIRFRNYPTVTKTRLWITFNGADKCFMKKRIYKTISFCFDCLDGPYSKVD